MTLHTRQILGALAISTACACSNSIDLQAGVDTQSAPLTQRAPAPEKAPEPPAPESDPMFEEHSRDPDVAGDVRLTPEEARLHDAQLMAKERGVPIAEVLDWLDFQDALDVYAGDLLKRFPSRVASVWADALPAKGGHIRFVGNVPRGIKNISGIELNGGARFSRQERSRRVRHVTRTLDSLGYRGIVGYADDTGKMLVRAVPSDVGSMVTAQEVADATSAVRPAPGDFRPEVDHFQADELEVTELLDLPVPAHSRGGDRIRNSTTGYGCTTGFTVRKPGPTYGVSTAAHCSAPLGFDVEYVEGNGGTYDDNFFQSNGNSYSEGDVAWYTTSHSEWPEFFSNFDNIRSVHSIQLTSLMVGKQVCQYGRSSNDETCGYQVKWVDQCLWMTSPINSWVCGMAIALWTGSGSSPIDLGDSGGPWFVQNKAYGVTSGDDQNYGFFTPVQVLQDSLGVIVDID